MPSHPPLLFDLDGTLVHSLPDIAASANHVRGHHGLEPVPEATVRTWVGDGARTLLERALAELPDPPDLDASYRVYAEHHEVQCTGLVAPFPGVTECLQRWRATGHPLAVVTNKPERFAQRVLAHLGMDSWFGAVVGGDSTAERKPSPLPLQRALEILGTSSDGALMVGDGVQDLRAGQALGIRTAAVLFGYWDEAPLRAAGADEYWPRFGAAEDPRAAALPSAE